MTTKPTLEASPRTALHPSPIAILASGYAAGERVRMRSELVDDAGVTWSAHADCIAAADGRIDLREAPSESGTYTGTSPDGLFWSMQPASGVDRRFMIEATQKPHKLGQPACDPLRPVVVRLTATGERSGEAATTVTFTRLADGIDVEAVREGRLRGTVFRWRDRTRPRGAIMSLTGSGGGVEMGYAPLLASLGYDVLSLAYFAYDDLPPAIVGIPLEYFEEGFQWMRRTLGSERIAIQGASRGGELALVLASYLPEYVAGTLAIVPMFAASAGWDPAKGAVGSSWTYRGRDVPYAPMGPTPSLEEMRAAAEREPHGLAFTPANRAEVDRPEVRADAAIPVERARGPILLISGVHDQMWPSAWGSDVVINRLRAHGFEHGFRHLALPESGHLTPLPNAVTTFARALFHSLLGIFLDCGGSPAGAARDSHATWQAMREHYRAVLGPTVQNP